MKLFMALFVLSLPLPAFAQKDKAGTCPVPEICNTIQAKFNDLKQTPGNKKKFDAVLGLLKKATAQKCKIAGVKDPVPAYRACYDQGFTSKIKNGQVVIDQNLPGIMGEMTVMDWFLYAEKSKFPVGKKFTRGKLFQSTLDGNWAETFSDEPVSESDEN